MKIILNRNEIKEIKALARKASEIAGDNIESLLNETFSISKKAYIAGFISGMFVITINENMLCELIQAECKLLDKITPVLKAVINLVQVATPAVKEFIAEVDSISDKYSERNDLYIDDRKAI